MSAVDVAMEAELRNRIEVLERGQQEMLKRIQQLENRKVYEFAVPHKGEVR